MCPRFPFFWDVTMRRFESNTFIRNVGTHPTTQRDIPQTKSQMCPHPPPSAKENISVTNEAEKKSIISFFIISSPINPFNHCLSTSGPWEVGILLRT
jgi:hypothetical protein